jgi:5-formyltetrahydrofolate cyclo-ligase
VSREEKEAYRLDVWERLRRYARPDSRFHWDFSKFIPDFKGSERCADRIRRLPAYRRARLLFITPDNCLEHLREKCIRDGKPFLMTPYAIRRDFLYLDPKAVPRGMEALASTLDGIERFAKPMSLRRMMRLGRVDMLVTGVSIVNTRGVRYGKGTGFFDIEWAIFRELGMVDDETPIVAVAHDCQVVEFEFPYAPHDTIVDYIITPRRTIKVERAAKKPAGIDWRILPRELFESIPPLQELAEIKGVKYPVSSPGGT